MPPAPTVDGAFSGGMLHGYLELFAASPDTLGATNVSFEIATTESSIALQRAAAPLQPTKDDPGCRIAGTSVSLADLPTGDYDARAVISIANRRVGQVTRPFRIAHVSATAK
jgi:hypothetical protein